MFDSDEYTVSRILESLKRTRTSSEEAINSEEHEIEELNLDEVVKMASNIKEQPRKSSKVRSKLPRKSQSDIHIDQPKVKRQKVSSTVKTIKEIRSSSHVKKFKSDQPKVKRKKVSSTVKTIKEIRFSSNVKKFKSDQPKAKRQKVSSTVTTIKEVRSLSNVKKFKSLRLRNPPKPFYNALNCLSILQKKKVIDMGFGSLLEFSCARIPSKLGHFIVDSFDAKSMKLKLENGDIQITPELIQHVYGIPCGGTSVESLVVNDKNKECYVDWRSQFVKELRPSDILRRIEETEDDGIIFVLNFIILFLNSMVECIPSGKCKTDVVERIDEDVDLKTVDWCWYIYDCLKKCKDGWKRDDIGSYFTGPVHVLILIYLQLTSFKQLDTPINVPAIKFWSVEMMKKREILEIESGGFGRCEIKKLPEKRVAQQESKLEIIRVFEGSLLTMLESDEYTVPHILESPKGTRTFSDEPLISEEHEIEELNLEVVENQPKVKRQKVPKVKKQKLPKVKRQKVSSIVNTIREFHSSSNVKKLKSLRLRNPPKPFYNALRCLSILQKKKVIDMGFGSLLEFSCSGIPSKLGHFVVDNFDAKSMKLKLENGDIQITPELIQHIYGIPCGGTSVESLVVKDKNNECYVNWHSQFVKELRPGDILRRIEETEDDGIIFVLNFIILFLNSMVDCVPSGKCKTDVLERIDEYVDLKTIDWCGYIYECLKKCKDGWKRDDLGSYFTGPLTLLILIYLEGTSFKKLDTPINIPAIRFWSVEMMKKREILEIESGGFGHCEIKKLSEKGIAQQESELEIMRVSADIDSKFASLLDAKIELEVLFTNALRKFPDSQIFIEKKDFFHSIFINNDSKDDTARAGPGSEKADQVDFVNVE